MSAISLKGRLREMDVQELVEYYLPRRKFVKFRSILEQVAKHYKQITGKNIEDEEIKGNNKEDVSEEA